MNRQREPARTVLELAASDEEVGLRKMFQIAYNKML